MELWLIVTFFGIVVVLTAVGVPLWISFLAGSVFYMTFDPRLNFMMAPQLLFSGVDKWTLLAIPLYVLSGTIISRGGVARHMVEFIASLVGHIRGGMLIAGIGACTFFAAMSGSGPATTVAIGSVMVSPLVAMGYDKKTAMGSIATGGVLGNIIPPSVAFVVVGSWLGLDIGKLFVGGVIPGLVLATALAGTAFFVSIRMGLKPSPKVSWRTRGRIFVKAIPALGMPAIILGGIYGGIFTPTEAAAVSCVYSVLASLLYREITWSAIKLGILDCVTTTARLFLIISTATLFAMILSYNNIPQMVTEFIVQARFSPVTFMIALLFLYLILGCLLDAMPIWAVTIPVVWPAALKLGIDPLHFCMFIVIAVIGGQATPPYGVNLFAMSGLTGESVEDISKGAIPFIVALYIAMFLIILIPKLSTWLPGTMG